MSSAADVCNEIVRIKAEIHQLISDSDTVNSSDILNLSEELDSLINIWMRCTKKAC